MRNKILPKTIIILSIAILILPSFSFVLAQNQPIEMPGTLDEAKEMGEEFSQEAKEKLPGILEKLWKEEVVPVWGAMWSWAKNWWQETIWPRITGFFKEKIKPPVEEEIEKRKTIIKEEFEKEKEELKKEAPEIGKSLWERFKEIIK